MGIADFLSEKICRASADDNGWSLDYSEGYAWGQTVRLYGKAFPCHALVGTDELTLGFRAGYFKQTSESLSQIQVVDISEAELIRRRMLAH